MLITKEKINSADIDLLINQLVEQNNHDKFIIVVPTNRKARQLKKEFIGLSPNNTVAALNIETLRTLFEKILLVSDSFIPLSEASSTVLIEQASQSVNKKYFTNYKHLPAGTLDRIKNVISEYKRHGIKPENLRIETEELSESEKLKAEDIASIYEVYLKKCLSLNALEIGDVYTRLNELKLPKLYSNFRTIFPKAETLLVNGFDEFTNPEVEILSKLADLKNLKLFIEFDYFNYNPLIFSHLDKCSNRLSDAGFKRIEDLGANEKLEFIQKIQSELFFNKSNSPTAKFKDEIVKINASSMREEIELIAKELKHLIVEKNVEPNKICVAFNLIENYSSIVRDVFESYGIPFNLTDRVSLDSSLPVNAVISFLEILENDFYFDSIFKALNSGFIDLKNIDKNNLKKIAAELKIVSGKNNWLTSISEYIENYKLLSFENHSLELDDLKKGKTDFDQLVDLLSPFSKKLTVKEFVENLKLLIANLGIVENLLEESEGFEETNIKGLTTFLETINEIFDLIENENGFNEEYKLNFFLDTIKTASKWARFNIKEKPDYGVLVTTINEIRGLRFDYLFLGGMIDSVFPTRYNPEIFFSGSFRKKELIHQTEERYHFYQALCTWKKNLYLSVPARDEKKELVESNFIKDLKKLFEITEITSNDYTGRIYSFDETLRAAVPKLIELNNIKVLNELKIDSDKISAAIDTNKLRSSFPFEESPFNGFIADATEEKINEALKQIGEKQFSISQLETFAKCPFKFFMERILKIEIEEEPSEDVEALEMGSLLHLILFEFYTEVKKKNLIIQNCSDEVFEKALDIMFSIAEKKIESNLFKSPISFLEKEKILGFAGNREQSLLYRFVDYERKNGESFIPSYFEVSFGKLNEEESEQEISTAQPIEFGGVKMGGKIDRVEIDQSNNFNIVDYKLSGKKPNKQELEDGVSLQLPVYIFAANKLLNKKLHEDFKSHQMIIYSLKFNQKYFGKQIISLTRKKNVDQTELINELLEKTKEHIAEYAEKMRNGKFNLSEHEKREEMVCRYCSFKPTCRVSEII